MSYNDYRSGRPPTSSRPSPATNPSTAKAYESFAARMNEPPPQRDTRPNRPSYSRDSPNANTASGSAPSASTNPAANAAAAMASVRGSLAGFTTSGRVDNPYATNAYASSRAGPSTSQPSSGMAPGQMEYYPSSKQKGNMQGKLKDTYKSTMALAKQDQWKIICVKATTHTLGPPKPKHVRTIMDGLRWGGSVSNRESPAGGIFYHLRKRMAMNQWIVTVKALCIFHHIFRDGNVKFVEFIANNSRAIFKMEFFSDSSPEGLAHMGFIKSYGAYLEQWLTMKAAIKFPPGKSKEDDPALTECYRQASIEELLASLPVIMDTVDALLGLQMDGSIKYTPVATPGFAMILRDMTIFWVTLSEGLIRLLDLFFTLEIPQAVIAADVYKRFVALVDSAQPFFDMAKSLNTRWQVPQLGAISLELMESMQQYIDNGPEQAAPAEPQFSDEEQYDDEPEPEPEPEPVPEHYYESEPEYYSEEEPEPLPMPPPRPPTPSSSSETVSSSSSEESSSEEEEEDANVLPSAPAPPPPPKAFDPLADLLGIHSGVGNGATSNAQTSQQSMALQVYGASGTVPGMHQQASFEQTVDDRVANVKGIMAANAGGNVQPRNGFGVDGTNMQVAMYGGPHAHAQAQAQAQAHAQQQQQMYNTMAMQHQQQLASYHTMAAYQTMAQNQMAQNQMAQNQMAQNQMAMYQMQQNGMHGTNGLNGMHRMGMMGAYTPTPQGNQAVPVMQAEAQQTPAGNYKVQRGTKPTRVNEDDLAFGPLIDQMKKASVSK